MLDLLKFSARYRIPTIQGGHHHAKAGWIQMHCPYCSGGRDGWHLGFSLDRGVFSCWRCGALRFWDVLAALCRTSNRDEIRQAVNEFQTGTKLPAKTARARQRSLKLPMGTEPLGVAHRRYLAGRGFDPEELETTWDVRGTAHLAGLWSWRVIIPIRDGDDRLVAYQGRAIGNLKPKYKMADDHDCLVSPDSLLYGIDKVPGDRVIIVEGAPGVWRLGAGAVATLGIGWHLAQANRLRRFTHRFIIFDPERAAQERAAALAGVLSLFPGTTEIVTGFRTDPGDFSPTRAAKVRKELGFGASVM